MPRERVTTTDGSAIITKEGRLITDHWRDISSGDGRCKAYRGDTWVVFRHPNGYMAQVSGAGRPARRRWFTRQRAAVQWLKDESDRYAELPCQPALSQ